MPSENKTINYERIKKMSIVEMARWLAENLDDAYYSERPLSEAECLEWLNSEVW